MRQVIGGVGEVAEPQRARRLLDCGSRRTCRRS
jgi:hypothetical protein